MSVEILYDPARDMACFYDTTTGEAFGPIFDDCLATDEKFVPGDTAQELAEAFLEHLSSDLGVADVRTLNPATLQNVYERWRVSVNAEERAT